MATFLSIVALSMAVYSDAFRMQSTGSSYSPLKMALADYKEELAKTAALIASPG
jgi:hypothetical protein